jgi:hypothetical protein
MAAMARVSTLISLLAAAVLTAGCATSGPATQAPQPSAAPAPSSTAKAGPAPGHQAVWGCQGIDPRPPAAVSRRLVAPETPTSDDDDDDDVPGGPLYGDPAAATRYWAAQSQSDCGLMATRMVVGELTGTPPSEPDMIALAKSTPSKCAGGQPVYDDSFDPSDGGIGHGTCMTDLLILLNHFGIGATYADDDNGTDTGISALEGYLGAGRQAIVCVNSHTIWGDEGDRTRCGHLITVAAVDTDADTVYLGDSGGDGTRGETVDIDTFEQAWATGDHALIVTNQR